jgi:hypothetical protein
MVSSTLLAIMRRKAVLRREQPVYMGSHPREPKIWQERRSGCDLALFHWSVSVLAPRKIWQSTQSQLQQSDRERISGSQQDTNADEKKPQTHMFAMVLVPSHLSVRWREAFLISPTLRDKVQNSSNRQQDLVMNGNLEHCKTVAQDTRIESLDLSYLVCTMYEELSQGPKLFRDLVSFQPQLVEPWGQRMDW